MRKFIFFACLIYCLNGVGHIIIGTVLEPMVDSYGISYGDGGQLIMNQFLGFLVGVLLAPMIIKWFGRKLTLALALFSFSFSQCMLGILPKWDVLLVTVPIGGAGVGIAETVVAALIVAHLKEKKASVLVLAEVFFGVGALLIPLVSTFFILQGQWQLSFIVVAVMAFLSLLSWLLFSFGELDPILKKQKKNPTLASSESKKRYSKKEMPLLLVGIVFFFMYVGTEMVFPNYLPTILHKTTNLEPSSLALSITVFWLAMTIGRLCMTFIIDKIGYSKLFIISCLGQLLGMTVFAFSPSIIISYIAVFFTGLLMGGIFSIGLLLINENTSGLEEWTTSILVAMGGLGGAFLPKVAGELLDRYHVTITLWALVLASFILVLLMGGIFYLRKTMSESQLHTEMDTTKL